MRHTQPRASPAPPAPCSASITSTAMSHLSIASPRPHHAVLLDSPLHLPWPPNPGGVDEHQWLVAINERRVHRIARGARLLAHDYPILPENGIDERGLADIRPPHHGELRASASWPCAGVRKQDSSACSSTSLAPNPWCALTGMGSPRPSSKNSTVISPRASGCQPC